MRYVALALLLVLVSCSPQHDHPEIPDIPEVVPASSRAVPEPPSPAVPEPIPEVVWPEPPVTVAVPEPIPVSLPSPRKGKGGEAAGERPEQVIREAQQAARVAPTKRGYFGASGSQRYIWVPGRIWDIYLSTGTGTKITLPPGETLAHALVLNPKSFDVNTANVGSELTTHSIILIRPCAASEEGCVPAREVDVAVTSMSGRSYNLHLIIGSVGMVEVSFEVTPIPYLEAPEPGMLPRRQP